MLVIAVQPLNAVEEMLVTVDGIVMLVSAVSLPKTFSPICTSPVLSVTLLSAVQSANALALSVL